MSDHDRERTEPGGTGQAPPGRRAATGQGGGRHRRRRRRGEQPVVPEAEFTSYYGMPVLNRPTWKALDIAGYLFLGGVAGGSSLLAAGAHATGRPALARSAKIGALGAVSASTVALIHDLGRPARFHHMLRVARPTSPMSMGSWLLAVYGPLAGIAATTEVAGVFRRTGAAATAGAALLGPAVASYTAVLISDTAVPTWHEGYRQLPFAFAGSATAAAGGLGMLAAPVAQAGPARRAAALGAALELGATEVMERRMGLAAEPLRQGRAGLLMRASKVLTAAGAAAGLLAGRRSRTAAALSGAALLAGSAALRFGFFHAGVASAEDPKYTVVPQRERLREREQERERRRGEPPGEGRGSAEADV
ncbi:NrfD/PsrC family molybdoenzyme membrane anchor subunit [Streptomyces sp. TRM 70361]|uniref:NrfD/PsrC family molybdoenzyme membrane anchor subunit n=1 Tax=Streptomyces sp. TRM 70361 TaxID=3116553 RepID=UPI002E7BBC64|nr:NrfD/PsrC family molybdoenzyme membrane anchor subunit [Streptomyces sp. TRM 70361]MEE1942041.1 NrfD/PsrC family molybdoenzyme membrane anchor subunit [Streptomyces sp. TRM 70361]